MKFTCSVEINQSIDKVSELFNDTRNLKEWQDGFISLDHISGTKGEPGAKSRIRYKAGRHEIELIETITEKDLPHTFKGTYEAKQMANTMKNRFISLGPDHTRWEAEIEYIRISSFMMKIMATLFPGMFRKQTQKWLDQFKAFAEGS